MIGRTIICCLLFSLSAGISAQSDSAQTTHTVMDRLRQVQQYLLKNSKSPQSLIESTGQRGCYRLNTTGSQDARQLMLQFADEQES